MLVGMHRVLGGVLVALALFAGCGGDDAEPTPEPTTPPAEASATPTVTQEALHKLGDEVVVSGTAEDEDGNQQAIELSVAPVRVHGKRVLVRLENGADDAYDLADGRFTIVSLDGSQAEAKAEGELRAGDVRRIRLAATGDPAQLMWEPLADNEPIYRWRLRPQ